jgi:Asp-tRNA(Asn)/Glu-tRNA(Gln) amidotransferase C subunit
MHFQDQVLRIDGGSGPQPANHSLIYRGDRQLLWILQHDKRRYTELTRETVEQISNQVSTMMAQMEEQLKSLPPEQREAMARIMKGRMPMPDAAPTSPPEIRKTGETADISGFPCTRYDVYQDGEKRAEVWATPRSRIPGAENLSAVFESLAEFYRSLTKGFAQFQTGLDFNVLAGLDGFPIRMLSYEDGELESEMLIKEVSQGSGASDLFERPVNYKEEKLAQR